MRKLGEVFLRRLRKVRVSYEVMTSKEKSEEVEGVREAVDEKLLWGKKL